MAAPQVLAAMAECAKMQVRMFVKGQRVVCIDDRFKPSVAKLFAALPVKDREYTVREVYLGQEMPGSDGATCGILLMELLNPVDARKRELGFNSERFAPLNEAEEESEEIEKGELVEV
jgi:hypothetical protein